MFDSLREQFFGFFKERGHAVAPSSSLVPDDPSVLLTTAGMQQFKKYYTGELDAQKDFGSARTTSIQKCFRTSDIEEVGDKSHLTFFEMMGNFTFGPTGSDDPTDTTGKDGYFKRAAIVWGWEFLTSRLGINPERMYVTVFEGDDATDKDQGAYDIWKNEIGLSQDRIRMGNRDDNFWGPTGNEGPCGPTTEIYVADSAEAALAGNGVEVWNIVFNEYFKDKKGAYIKTKDPGIDTGMGFERLLAVLEGETDVFATSAFKEIVDAIQQRAGVIEERDLRVVADHVRGSVFLIGDGIEPSNKEAGYVLRRLLRRVIGLSLKYDVHEGIFEAAYQVIKKQYGTYYPEITNEKEILTVWNEERSKFQEAIGKGIKALSKYETITGADAFYLYETFGLPFEITKELAPQGAADALLYADFEQALEAHKEVSRAGVEKKFGGHGLVLDTGELKAADDTEMKKVIQQHTATHLLQWALRKVLGAGVQQQGSDITAKRLRFDFSFERKMTDEEKGEVERLVNEQIQKDLPVSFAEMSKEEAEKEGALAFFKEKYPDVVTVYSIGTGDQAISKELCGGPHVSSTGEIGTFSILKEESVGKGVRRIRATVT
jgi:alanyl-tRNA synthetase